MNKILISSIILLLLDSIFIYVIHGKFNNQIKLIQGEDASVNMFAVIITYLFLKFGFVYFIINRKSTVKDAFILGLCIYGVFEFTNKSLLKKWKYDTAIIDTIWGGCLFALTKYIVDNIVL